MKFNYQARTKDGDTQAGQVEASSKEAAVNLLQQHSLYVTFLQEAKPPLYALKLNLFGNISRKEIVLFSRQLSIMFKSKVSLIEALRSIGSQTKNADLKEKIFHISEEVEGGTSFSKAISNYPKLFSPFYVAMVKSGEVSGKLSQALNYLADHLEREYYLISKAKGALVYPSLILVVVVGVLLMMTYFVLPNLSQVLLSSGVDLPLITKIVLKMGDFIRKAGWVLILLSGVAAFLFSKFYRSPKGKEVCDRWILNFPLAGNLIKMINVSRFAENLATLISGGLPITQALGITGDIIDNISYKKIIFKARDDVKKGEPISSVLEGAPVLFPPIFTQMVRVGERTGTLDVTLLEIVEFFQKDIERSIDGLIGVLEPVLIIFLGGLVGGMLLSVLMPLYQTISM
ncbi:MAG: type II secretion system F family protein [Candidatus Pacebacteria bacterium]|nr:type II secretion system F family protein [Candidatus Paceibacterota bacterium]